MKHDVLVRTLYKHIHRKDNPWDKEIGTYMVDAIATHNKKGVLVECLSESLNKM